MLNMSNFLWRNFYNILSITAKIFKNLKVEATLVSIENNFCRQNFWLWQIQNWIYLFLIFI